MDAKEAQVREKLEDCLKQATELTGRTGNAVSSLVQLAAVLVNAIRLTSNHAKKSPEVSAGVQPLGDSFLSYEEGGQSLDTSTAPRLPL